MEVNVVKQEPGAEEIRQPSRPSGVGGGQIQVSEALVQRIALEIQEELKSERVQEMLKAMPAWYPEGKSIHRVRAFSTPEVAALFCGLVTAMAGAHALPVTVQFSDRNVKVILHAKRTRGRIGPLTEEVVNLAAEIG